MTLYVFFLFLTIFTVVCFIGNVESPETLKIFLKAFHSNEPFFDLCPLFFQCAPSLPPLFHKNLLVILVTSSKGLEVHDSLFSMGFILSWFMLYAYFLLFNMNKKMPESILTLISYLCVSLSFLLLENYLILPCFLASVMIDFPSNSSFLLITTFICCCESLKWWHKSKK